MIDLTDRIVLITGAAGGIGSATARTLAAARRESRSSFTSWIRRDAPAADLGDRAVAFTVDLRDRVAVDGLWRDAVGVHGRIDVLVNNAGIYPPAPLDLDVEAWTGVWDLSLGVNLVAPAILCRAAIRTFSAQDGGGTIINMASRAAFRGEDPEFWHYAAAKAGVVAMTRTIARQYGRDGITAFALAPGYVDTDFNRPFAEKFGVEAAARDTGLGEVAQPQDVANVIAFLASGLARHATGTTIDINSASYVR